MLKIHFRLFLLKILLFNSFCGKRSKSHTMAMVSQGFSYRLYYVYVNSCEIKFISSLGEIPGELFGWEIQLPLKLYVIRFRMNHTVNSCRAARHLLKNSLNKTLRAASRIVDPGGIAVKHRIFCVIEIILLEVRG